MFVNQKKSRFIRNVIIKTFLLFGFFNLAFAVFQPIETASKISAYNILFPGRPRLPFGENPEEAYNLTIDNIPAMFAAHKISGSPKPEGEFRVLLIGDSSVWGYLLRPDETISARINQAELTTLDGREMRAFNLGYPTISLTKDLMFLDQAVKYDPDLVVWLVTLEAFPQSKQLESPILQSNPQHVIDINQTLDLDLTIPQTWLSEKPPWGRTIISQRRDLADLFRLQMYGVLWAATGIDQVYPETYPPPAKDLENDTLYYGMAPGMLDSNLMTFKALSAGKELIGKTPLLIVNEPIYISDGTNSDIRYNYFYPRWAYDQYRIIMDDLSTGSDWLYLDAWNLVPSSDFTNSAIHMNPSGTRMLAGMIQDVILTASGNHK